MKKPKKYKGKMTTKIVIDTHLWDEHYAKMTEQEKTDYWNKQVKKGEANF